MMKRITLLTLFLLFFFSYSLESHAQSLGGQERADALQQELDDLAAAGIKGVLYWQYSGDISQERNFGSDVYSFFKGDPICDVLAANVGNFDFLGVNISSLVTSNNVEDALDYLSDTCNINMIRIFVTPDRNGNTSAAYSTLLAANDRGIKVIVTICDFVNTCRTLGIDNSVVNNPTEWYRNGYQTDGYLDYAKEIAALFKDNPGLYGYELLNEPHCGGDATCVQIYSDWANSVAAAIRSVDSGHNIGIGQMAGQPGTRGDSAGAGSPPDFSVSNASSSLSMASGHYYTPDEKQQLITLAKPQADALGKFFYIGELGLTCPEGDPSTCGLGTLACAMPTWQRIGPGVSTPKLACVCPEDTCKLEAERASFPISTSSVTGQKDGNGTGDYSFYDHDIQEYVDVLPMLPNLTTTNSSCNPFNCFAPYVNDFDSSLQCAANSIPVNKPTWYWVDKYGPYCDNETKGLPFAYNLFANFYDKYVPSGAARTCNELPPNTPRPSDSGIACPSQTNPARQPGDPAFDYYRDALVQCPIPPNQQYWTNQNSLGYSPEELADYMFSLNITYLGISLSNTDRAALIQVLEMAKAKNINPWILVGIWGTESAWNQIGSCSNSNGNNNGSAQNFSCNIETIPAQNCMFKDGGIVSYQSYDSTNETGHGSNKYWAIPACRFEIPINSLLSVIDTDTSLPGIQSPQALGPNYPGAADNVCYRTDEKGYEYYGYAADFQAKPSNCRTVYLPEIDGVDRWNIGKSFASATKGVGTIATGIGNGNVLYKMTILHLNSIRGNTTLNAGDKLGELFVWTNQNGNDLSHVHIEIIRSYDNGLTWEVLKPEEHLCT